MALIGPSFFARFRASVGSRACAGACALAVGACADGTLPPRIPDPTSPCAQEGPSMTPPPSSASAAPAPSEAPPPAHDHSKMHHASAPAPAPSPGSP